MAKEVKESKEEVKDEPPVVARKKRDHERDLDLIYVVKIKTYGKPSKARFDTGKTLARVIGLNFQGFEISDEKTQTQYDWSWEDHRGGAPGVLADEAVDETPSEMPIDVVTRL